jgi:hypothetical protein
MPTTDFFDESEGMSFTFTEEEKREARKRSEQFETQ